MNPGSMVSDNIEVVKKQCKKNFSKYVSHFSIPTCIYRVKGGKPKRVPVGFDFLSVSS